MEFTTYLTLYFVGVVLAALICGLMLDWEYNDDAAAVAVFSSFLWPIWLPLLVIIGIPAYIGHWIAKRFL